MALIAHRSNQGFTLLEAMISVFILTIVMLWSLQGLMTVNRSAYDNKIREEAVKLGQELLVDARTEPYVTVTSNLAQNITRQIASYDISFTVNQVVAVLIPGISKSVVITIQWDGGNHSYVAQTVVSDK